MNMKNREIILWSIIIALVGAFVLYISLNNKQTVVNIKTTNTANQSPTKTNNNVLSYTLSEVATHNTQKSCWTVIDGKIYDITSYISSHQAGISKIMRGCGVDATNMYGRVGAHDVSRLANVFVGNLK